MIRRPPISTLDRSSAASDVYKRQLLFIAINSSAGFLGHLGDGHLDFGLIAALTGVDVAGAVGGARRARDPYGGRVGQGLAPGSTHISEHTRTD